MPKTEQQLLLRLQRKTKLSALEIADFALKYYELQINTRTVGFSEDAFRKAFEFSFNLLVDAQAQLDTLYSRSKIPQPIAAHEQTEPADTDGR